LNDAKATLNIAHSRESNNYSKSSTSAVGCVLPYLRDCLRAKPTGIDEEAADALLQVGVEAAQSNADLAEYTRDELPLGERAVPSANHKVAEFADERRERLPQTAVAPAVAIRKNCVTIKRSIRFSRLRLEPPGAYNAASTLRVSIHAHAFWHTLWHIPCA
jgi:hypothetical protein